MLDYTKHPLNKRYDLDSALTSIWEFYKKWFGSLMLISFVFSLITSYLTGRINISEMYSVDEVDEMMAIVRSMIGPYLLIILFAFVFGLILHYYVIRKPVDPDSNIFSIGTTGIVKFFLPLLVLNIMLAVFAVFAITFGILLLFIGALFATVYIVMIYAFISPVLMIEDKGIGDTLTTTIRLAHKHFWPNMGWVSIFIIILMVISFILGAIIMIPFGYDKQTIIYYSQCHSQRFDYAPVSHIQPGTLF
jgi:membrane protease YdiL (CAAX protease family)